MRLTLFGRAALPPIDAHRLLRTKSLKNGEILLRLGEHGGALDHADQAGMDSLEPGHGSTAEGDGHGTIPVTAATLRSDNAACIALRRSPVPACSSIASSWATRAISLSRSPSSS